MTCKTVLPVPLILASLVSVAGCAAAVAASLAMMPKQLHGTWDAAPGGCKSPVAYDTQSLIRIGSRATHGYEMKQVPIRVRRVSMDPAVWVITKGSDAAPGISFSEVYVLKGNFLTITDGERSTDFHRCT